MRSTWKQRVARIISLMHEAAADVSDLSLPTCVQDVIDSGLLLGNSSEEQGGGRGARTPTTSRSSRSSRIGRRNCSCSS